MEHKCEFCGEEITLNDVKNGICGCGFPIPQEIKDEIISEAGIVDKPPEPKPESKPDSQLPPVIDCLNCGLPMTEKEFNSGDPCPSCNQMPKETKDEIINGAGVVDKPPVPKPELKPELKPESEPEPEIELPPVIECLNCGLPMTEKEFNSGDPCPSCNQIPIQPGIPPSQFDPPIQESLLLEVVIGSEIGKKINLHQEENLGRLNFENGTENSKPNCYDYISGTHLKFKWSNGQLKISDLDSTNGTFVNAEKLQGSEERIINIGDFILIGKGAGIFRLINYSQHISKSPSNLYQLRHLQSGVVFPIDIKRKTHELIGRAPDDSGNLHPFLHYVCCHRVSEGEELNQVIENLRYISRKQCALKYRSDTQKWCIINYSSNGTIVNGKKIQLANESLDIGTDTKILIGKDFEFVFEKYNS